MADMHPRVAGALAGHRGRLPLDLLDVLLEQHMESTLFSTLLAREEVTPDLAAKCFTKSIAAGASNSRSRTAAVVALGVRMTSGRDIDDLLVALATKRFQAASPEGNGDRQHAARWSELINALANGVREDQARYLAASPDLLAAATFGSQRHWRTKLAVVKHIHANLPTASISALHREILVSEAHRLLTSLARANASAREEATLSARSLETVGYLLAPAPGAATVTLLELHHLLELKVAELTEAAADDPAATILAIIDACGYGRGRSSIDYLLTVAGLPTEVAEALLSRRSGADDLTLALAFSSGTGRDEATADLIARLAALGVPWKESLAVIGACDPTITLAEAEAVVRGVLT